VARGSKSLRAPCRADPLAPPVRTSSVQTAATANRPGRCLSAAESKRRDSREQTRSSGGVVVSPFGQRHRTKLNHAQVTIQSSYALQYPRELNGILQTNSYDQARIIRRSMGRSPWSAGTSESAR
jgi:hypothetical protein